MSDYDMNNAEQDLDLSFAAEQILPEGKHEYRIIAVKQKSFEKNGVTKKPVIIEICIECESDEGEPMTFHESVWFDLQHPKMGHFNARNLAKALGGTIEGRSITGITPFADHVGKMGTLDVKRKNGYTNFNNMTPED